MTVRHCPECSRFWVPKKDDTDAEMCPTCRFEIPKLSTAYDGKPTKDGLARVEKA